MTQARPELLAPAGNLEKMHYAFSYGADAVYAGMPQYSLRARENGFDQAAMIEGIRTARALGKKFYVTANLLPHNRKIQGYLNKIEDIMAEKPDALIMADPGLIALTKERYPDAEIHLSVQANTMNWASAKFWHEQGVSRIIMSREIPIDEMKEIKDRVPGLEIEAFVHGAICIAHSGRCMLSNYFNRRDPNQGLCTNACRWPYRVYEQKEGEDLEEGRRYQHLEGTYFLEEISRPGEYLEIDEDESGTYIMNAKDLMAIEYLDQMRDAGIDSFKIEGRTKSIYYLAVTTLAYRRAIDDLVAGRPLDEKNVELLRKIHHRGYTPGFLAGYQGPDNQNYHTGEGREYTQEFIGTVIGAEDGRVLVSPRGPVRKGELAEFIRPEGDSFYLTIDRLELENGDSVDAAHAGAGKNAWLYSDQFKSSESPMALLSRVVPAAEMKSAC